MLCSGNYIKLKPTLPCMQLWSRWKGKQSWKIWVRAYHREPWQSSVPSSLRVSAWCLPHSMYSSAFTYKFLKNFLYNSIYYMRYTLVFLFKFLPYSIWYLWPSRVTALMVTAVDQILVPPPPQFKCWIPNPTVMALEGESLGGNYI